MVDEDMFDDCADEFEEDSTIVSRLKDENRNLASEKEMLKTELEMYVRSLNDVGDYFEVRFPVLKGHQPDDFLDVAFRELDKLQDSYDEIMNYVNHIFPDLKAVAQKDVAAAVISKIDDLKKKYSELESQVQSQPAGHIVASSDGQEQELSQIRAENAELKNSEKNFKDTLQEIRNDLEARFWSLKGTPPENFLVAAFKEIDELQDGNEALMEYLRASFPELKDKPHTEASAAAITLLDALKKRYSALEEQSKSAKPSEELPDKYKQELDQLKKHAFTLEEQLKSAKEAAAVVVPSDQYKQELDAAKKELDEAKQHRDAELQGKEKQIAGLKKDLEKDSVALKYILGNECFEEYQKQSFSNEDEKQQWLTSRVYTQWAPINPSDPHAHENARLHAEARNKKLKALDAQLKATLEDLSAFLTEDSKHIINICNRIDNASNMFDDTSKQYDE